MYALKIDATVAANHHLSIDLPASFPVGEAEVIILAKAPASTPPNANQALDELFDWLDTLPTTGRTAEEINTQIREERDSWGE